MNRARLVGPVLFLVAAGAAWWSGATLERRIDERSVEEELLYLPNGKLLGVMSLGHETLLADVYYLWAIQYYSNYERDDRYRYVEHVFDRVITELDPHYTDAYWMGALVLILEARDLDAGLRLLDKGIALNPDSWLLPYLAGWECYHAGQPDRGARYMAQAEQVPGAPVAVRRVRAGMVSRAGQIDQAIELWLDVLEDPDSDEQSRAIAERQVRELRVRRDVDRLDEALASFHKRNGRFPRELAELLEQGYIPTLPVDPNGNDYRYDPRSGRVSSTAGRLL